MGCEPKPQPINSGQLRSPILRRRDYAVRKLIEETLVSADGVFAGPANPRYLEYRDETYLRDGLGWLLGADAMLYGRTTYEAMSQIWPRRGGGGHIWADRLNEMKKYVFSSTLQEASWN